MAFKLPFDTLLDILALTRKQARSLLRAALVAVPIYLAGHTLLGLPLQHPLDEWAIILTCIMGILWYTKARHAETPPA